MSAGQKCHFYCFSILEKDVLVFAFWYIKHTKLSSRKEGGADEDSNSMTHWMLL